MNNYPLGKNQIAVLQALGTFDIYYKGCGWVYLYHSDTVEVLTALIKKGLVKILNHEDSELTLVDVYVLTEAGISIASAADKMDMMDLNNIEFAA